VHYMQDAPVALRREFATTALRNLAEAYSAEATLARQEAGRHKKDANLRGWSIAVDRFAQQVPLLLDDITLGLPVNLSMGGGQSLSISVADRVIILGHPRLNQQSVFEQQILSDFCSRHDCEQFMPAEAAREPIPMSTLQVRPDWMFSSQGPVCSYKGIQVSFENAQNLGNARIICAQFMQEVVTLTEEFAWQQRHGVAIDWEELEVSSAPRRPEHMVRLNGAGDTVLITIPILYGSRGLLEHILPWIQLRLNKQMDAIIELEARHYGWH
jgi:hypothetical protein